MKLAIVIPAYNEAETIGNVLKNLPKKLNGVDQIVPIVVDDGSMDKTYDLAKKNTRYVIRHVVNLGVGAATTTGFEAAKRLNSDIVVTMDADGQHNPNDIKKIIKPILDRKADIVIGTRMLTIAGMPIIKIIGNWFMNFITFLVFRKWTTDSQSGMKALNKKACTLMTFHSLGYEICSEIIGEVKRNNLAMKEIPIETIYTDYSKIKGQNWLNGANVLIKMITIRLLGKKR